jgi:hypothetical protein
LIFTLWYAWLGLETPNLDEDLTVVSYVRDAQTPQAQQQFLGRLDQSLAGVAQALRPGSWLTLFYQHQNLAYWTPIVESAAKHSLRYINLVPQPQQIRSFAQHRNPFETLAGHLIVNFRKLPAHAFRQIYRDRNNRVLFPNLRKFAELELQRVIVEYLGADTETIAFHLISVLLDPSLMSERLNEALNVVELLRSQDLESLGAVFANGKENLWMLRPEVEIDPVIDFYDRLRYHLFAFLRRRHTATLHQLQTEATQLLQQEHHPGELGELRLPAILTEFAERVGDRWQYSPERRASTIEPRLMLARSSADKLRPVFFTASHRLLRVRIDSLTLLSDRYTDAGEQYQSLQNVLVAALTEIRNRFTSRVESVWAIDELASGELRLDEITLEDVPLGIVLRDPEDNRAELQTALAKEVFVPLFLHTGIMVLGILRSRDEEPWSKEPGALVMLDRSEA